VKTANKSRVTAGFALFTNMQQTECEEEKNKTPVTMPHDS
jgi:hypothetical protein